MGNDGHVLGVNNVIRYNLVTGGRVGIGIKNHAYFTGRNKNKEGAGYSDVHADKSVEVHHNIIQNATGYGIGVHWDFAQVHNNIIDSTGEGIRSMYGYWSGNEGYSYHYKVAIYNNTILNPTSDVGYYGMGVRWADWIDERVFVYLYNNIMDGVGNGPVAYCEDQGITVKLHCSSETRNIDYSNAHVSHNYMYRPDEPTLYRVNKTTYTSSEFEGQSVTAAPRIAYTSDYSSDNPLYRGTVGADKYRIYANHSIRSGVTASNAGVGRMHPYLPRVLLPSYIGAVNPNDDAWVAGVLGLSSIQNLRNASGGDPFWVEGSTAPEPPGNLKISE
jgi:hypothetical protein